MRNFIKTYWTSLSAVGSVVLVTASFIFWMDATYEHKDSHDEDLCEVRNNLIVLGNGLSKIVLKEQVTDILKRLAELESQEGTLSQERILAKLTMQNNLDRLQQLLVQVESADLEDLKYVCSESS